MERRALQIVLAVIACVPVLAGGAGVVLGPALNGVAEAGAAAESHFRYLSGLLLAIGLTYWSCVPAIETKSAPLTLLTAIVFIGGLGRAFGWIVAGPPTPAHQAALVIELAIAPAVWFWQRRVAGATVW